MLPEFGILSQSHFPNLQKGVVGAANVAQPTREYAEHAQSPGFHTNWQWWHTASISEVGKRRQEGQNFKASLGYMRPYVQKRGRRVVPVAWIPAYYVSLPTMLRGQ